MTGKGEGQILEEKEGEGKERKVDRLSTERSPKTSATHCPQDTRPPP